MQIKTIPSLFSLATSRKCLKHVAKKKGGKKGNMRTRMRSSQNADESSIARL